MFCDCRFCQPCKNCEKLEEDLYVKEQEINDLLRRLESAATFHDKLHDPLDDFEY